MQLALLAAETSTFETDVTRPGVGPIRARAQMATRLRGMDWSAVGMPPPASWDQNLINALNLMLEARFPMFIAWGPDLRLFYNDAYEPVLVGKFGCLAQPMREVFPEAWSEVGELLAKAMNGQSSFLEDYHVPLVRNAQLSSTWWSFSYSPIRGEEGGVAGVLGIVYETTRRFLADEALRSSEAAMRSLADTAPGLLWKCAPDGLLTWANQRLADYFGEPGLGFARWDDRVHPEDIEAAQCVYADCIAAGRPFEMQQRLMGADGEYRWFMVRCQQVIDAQGGLIEWCGTAQDVDEWRTAAERLGVRDQLFRDFHDSDATLLWVADTTSRQIQVINPDSRPAWALPAADTMTWDNWVETVHPVDRQLFRGAFDSAAAGKTVQLRFRRLTDAGAARWLQLTAFSLGHHSGRIGGLVVELGAAEDPRIYLVDRNLERQQQNARALVQRGFRVRTFNTLGEFERVCDDLCPGCAVLAIDGDLERMARVATALRDVGHLNWLAIGDFQERLPDVVSLMKLGALDVVSAPTPEAVVMASKAAFELAGATPRETAPLRSRLADLTPREREVLEGLISGGTNKTIAQTLQLSPRTVETHRAHLMDRLGASTLADLVRIAASAGLVAPAPTEDSY